MCDNHYSWRHENWRTILAAHWFVFVLSILIALTKTPLGALKSSASFHVADYNDHFPRSLLESTLTFHEPEYNIFFF